ncbi:MAG TPA: septum formation initiator family protein [Bryobacteraceae bacterium]|nr:septum formation initiator family protein [Bryobacteraceae bacterium]
MLKTAAYLAAFVILGTCVLLALRGPQGLPVLLEKRQQIRELQEKNADLQREIQTRRVRLERLRNNPDEQQLEIRERLKMLKPGEVRYIVPEPAARPADEKALEQKPAK